MVKKSDMDDMFHPRYQKFISKHSEKFTALGIARFSVELLKVTAEVNKEKQDFDGYEKTIKALSITEQSVRKMVDQLFDLLG